MNVNDLIQTIETRLSADYAALEAKAKKWRAEQNGVLVAWQTKVLKNDLAHINNIKAIINAFYEADEKRYRVQLEIDRTIQKYNDLRLFCRQNGIKVSGLKSTLWIENERQTVNAPVPVSTAIHQAILNFQSQAKNNDNADF